jgi:hypothetical protein
MMTRERPRVAAVHNLHVIARQPDDDYQLAA